MKFNDYTAEELLGYGPPPELLLFYFFVKISDGNTPAPLSTDLKDDLATLFCLLQNSPNCLTIQAKDLAYEFTVQYESKALGIEPLMIQGIWNGFHQTRPATPLDTKYEEFMMIALRYGRGLVNKTPLYRNTPNSIIEGGFIAGILEEALLDMKLLPALSLCGALYRETEDDTVKQQMKSVMQLLRKLAHTEEFKQGMLCYAYRGVKEDPKPAPLTPDISKVIQQYCAMK